MDLSAMTPAEIDTIWLEKMGPYRAKFEAAARKMATATRYLKAGASYREIGDRYEADAKALYAEGSELRKAADAPFMGEWEKRGGWTRAYLVPGGHIHKSTSCSTLYPTTIIGWLPELSGHSEEEIVKAAGVNACTVCYPTAPVAELRAALDAEKNCPGSRSYDYTGFSRTSYTGSGRAKCTHCGGTFPVSKNGVMRVHEKPKVAA